MVFQILSPVQTILTTSGTPAAGGSIWTYQPGTTNPIATYTDSTGLTLNTNPIILNAFGQCQIWGEGSIRLIASDSLGNVLFDTITQSSDIGIAVASAAMTPVIEAPTIAAASALLDLASTAWQPVISSATTQAGLNLANYQNPASGSVVRPLSARLGDTVSILDWTPLGGTPAANTAGLQAALNSLTTGGTVNILGPYTYVINSITIPVGVTLQGPYGAIGAPGKGNFSPPYGNLAALQLSANSTIIVNGGGGINGVFLYPYGMTFQQTTTSSFAGTAIYINGDDTVITNNLIMGFSQAITSNGFSRLRIRNNNIDCLSGIAISGSTDVCHLDDNHCWPFATIQQGGSSANLQRSGYAYSMINCEDDTKMIGCFSYGYQGGFVINSCLNVQMIGCSADNTQNSFGTGFSIVGTSNDTVMSACTGSGCVQGYYIAVSQLGLNTRMIGCDSWGHTNHCVLMDAGALGDLYVSGGIMRDSPNGITVATPQPRLNVDAVTFVGITGGSTSIINLTVPSQNVFIQPNCFFSALTNGSSVTGSNCIINDITASGSVLALPPIGNYFYVNYTAPTTTSFGTLEGGWANRIVTLVFEGPSSVFSSTGAATAMRLSGNATYTTAGGGTLVLAHDGGQWYQTGGVP